MTANALQTSVKLLSKKDYSSIKLKLALQKKMFSENEIDDALLILKQKNYLNDHRYTEDRAIGLLKKKYGNRYIHSKLENESLSLTEEEINTLRREYNLEEVKVLKEVITERGIDNKKDDYHKCITKLMRYLVSRGFELELVSTELGLDNVDWD